MDNLDNPLVLWRAYFKLWNRKMKEAGIDPKKLVVDVEFDDGASKYRSRPGELAFWKVSEIDLEIARNKKHWALVPGSQGEIAQTRISGSGEYLLLQLADSVGYTPKAIAAVFTAALLYDWNSKVAHHSYVKYQTDLGRLFVAASLILTTLGGNIPWNYRMKRTLPVDARTDPPKPTSMQEAMEATAQGQVEFFSSWRIVRASFPQGSRDKVIRIHPDGRHVS